MPFIWLIALAIEAVVIAITIAKPCELGNGNDDGDGSAS